MANISTYPIGTPAAGDLIPGTQKFTDANGKTENLTRNFTVKQLVGFSDSTAAYSVYTSRWSQSGTDAPTDGVLQNTTGLTFAWSRSGAGNYTLIANAAYDLAKITGFATLGAEGTKSPASTGAAVCSLVVKNSTEISVKQLDASDKTLVDVVESGFIEIRIYD